MNLSEQIKQKFLYQPTKEQENLLKILANFLLSSNKDEIFLLKGYAGTGKTTLVSALVRALDGMKQKCILLAPTGRAAPKYSRFTPDIRLTPSTGVFTASVPFRTRWIILR